MSEPSEKGGDCPLTSTLPLDGATGEPQVRAVRSGLITMLTVTTPYVGGIRK